MNRPFAVFDIDGTIVRWQLFHAIVTQLADTGKLPDSVIETITKSRQMWNERTYTESFHDYEMSIVYAYRDALKSISQADLLHAVDIVFEQHKDQVYRYTRDLIARLKSENYLLFAVSGSHQEVVDKLGEYYGFDAVVGAQYEVVDGKYTGERTSPATDGKGPIVKQLVADFDASWQGSIAIGDSLSDGKMLELVEHPIAFNPDQKLFTAARDNGWQVVVERKNMIYTLTQQDGQFALTDTNNE